MNHLQIANGAARSLLLAIILGLPALAMADCRLNDRNGPNRFPLAIPAFVNVPFNKAPNDVVWQSGPRTVRVYCWVDMPQAPNVKFDIHVRMGAAGSGMIFAGLRLSHTVVFDGREAPSANYSWQIPTGHKVSYNDGGITFDGTYNIILRRANDFYSNGPSVPAESQYGGQYPGVTFLVEPDGAATGQPQHLTQWFNTTFLFEGQGTCVLQAGDQNQTVRLPPVTRQQLDRVGATAGRVPFSLRFGNCNSQANWVAVRLLPMGGAPSDETLVNQGDASGVAVKMGVVDSGAAVRMGEPLWVAVRDQGATLRLFAEYLRTGELTPGSVRSQAEVYIQYQ